MKIKFEDIKPGMSVGDNNFPYHFLKISEKFDQYIKVVIDKGGQLFEGVVTRDKIDNNLVTIYDIQDAEIIKEQSMVVSANIGEPNMDGTQAGI